MNPHQSAMSHRTALAALALTLFAASALGCNASQDPGLRTNLAALRAAHGDSSDIGSLDETAPPANLDQYRRPVDTAHYSTVSVSRHPLH